MIPPLARKLRELVCRTCPTPCAAHLAGTIEIADPSATCAATPPRWLPAPPKRAPLGLGDAVALVAQPAARVIDKIAGTDLKNCAACNQRHRDWNHAVPDILHPFSGKKPAP